MAVPTAVETYLDGIKISCVLKTITPETSAEALDATTLCKTSKVYQIGHFDGGLALTGIWDADAVNADELEDLMTAAFKNKANVQIISSIASALAAGGYAQMFENAKVDSYAYNAEPGALIMAEAHLKTDNNPLETGVIVCDENDDSGGTNGASVDNGAASTNGGYFQAHLYEESDSAATDMDITLQHSANDSTWADLIALQSVGGAAGVVTGTVAAGTTVDRYLRCIIQATTGKGYVIAAFSRR